MTVAPGVRDRRPPLALVRMMNPVLRTVLRSPLGRLVRPFALLEVRGRRTGRTLRIPVGWHLVADDFVVVTPAPWRENLRGGAPVVVHHRGVRHELFGTLDDDPSAVAETLQRLAERYGSLRPIGVDVPDGKVIEPADVLAVDRAVIRFRTR